MQRSRKAVLVIGDIIMDTIVHDNIAGSFDQIAGGVIFKNQITHTPGGSGLLFAEYLQEHGASPILYGKIGNDHIGKELLSYIKYKSIKTHVKVENLCSNESIIVRDQDDTRMLITSNTNIDNLYNDSDVMFLKKTCSDIDMLYISGHCIKEQNCRMQFTRDTISYFSSINKTIVIDIVPHTIYHDYSFEEYYKIIKKADIVFSDVATIRRFLKLGCRGETITDEMALETGVKFCQYFDRFALRYGNNGITSEVFCINKHNIYIQEVALSIIQSHEKRGFGDFLAAYSLKNDFKLL